MSKSRILPIIGGVVTLLVTAGLVGGSAYYWVTQSGDATVADPHAGHDHASESNEDDMLPMTEQAYRNLGLTVGKAQLGTHFRYLEMPGVVIEKPGHSDHALAAPVNGVVTRILAVPGQAVREGDKLFEIEVIDEALTEAQLALLNSLSRVGVIEQEIKRLQPLVEVQAVQGSRIIDLRNEQQQLEATQQLRRQELALRGLSVEQIATIVQQQKLISKFTVRVPDYFHAEAGAIPNPNDPGSNDGAVLKTVSAPQATSPGATAGEGWDFTVEHLEVFPGKAISRGDDLCHLAYHTSLYIRGEAFENELDAISQLKDRGWSVTAEFGLSQQRTQREGLHVRYIDNHVDEESQTFHFYLPLANEVVQDQVDESGKVFRTWKFKPGQRAHVRIPVERFEDQIKLPREAVVREGPQAFVFRKLPEHAHSHDDHDHGHDHADEPFIEFQQIPVRLLFADARHAIVASSDKPKADELKAGDTIALNHAFPLLLEIEKQRSGGGHHGHNH